VFLLVLICCALRGFALYCAIRFFALVLLQLNAQASASTGKSSMVYFNPHRLPKQTEMEAK
jgi:predicted metal-dependent peptidase